jgi:AraC family transcriptional regulator
MPLIVQAKPRRSRIPTPQWRNNLRTSGTAHAKGDVYSPLISRDLKRKMTMFDITFAANSVNCERLKGPSLTQHISALMSGSDDFPTAIPSLIGAAVATFDADRDTSRRYLQRAMALLDVRCGAPGVESARRSDRGGLLVWQLNGVVDYIETHLSDKITAGDLADLVNLSKTQLSRAFKISVGVPPFRYIVRRRLELACTMMRTTRESLAQVAVACGLCDQAHFSRLFRSVIGMTPSAWRRAMLAQDTANFRIIDVGSIRVDQRDPAPAPVTHPGR